MVNLKIEDLRRKAWIVYNGEKGLELVNKEVLAYGKDEENVNPEEEKELMNRIIKKVFVDPMGLDRAKHILSLEVKNVPAYDKRKILQGGNVIKPLNQPQRVHIFDRVDIKGLFVRLLFLCLAIIAVYGVFYLTSFKPVKSCDAKSGDDRDNCFMLVALNGLNESLCEKISAHDKSINCVKSVAVKLNDSVMCVKIPKDTPESVALYENCMICIAYKTKDTRICDKLGDSLRTDDCRKQIERGMSLIC